MIKVLVKQDLINKIFNNERRQVARAISIVEDSIPEASELLKQIYSNVGNAYRIGITGPPGAGNQEFLGAAHPAGARRSARQVAALPQPTR